MPLDLDIPAFDAGQIHQADLRRVATALRLLQRSFADHFRLGGQEDTPALPVIDLFPAIVRSGGAAAGTPQYSDNVRYYLTRAVTEEGLATTDVYNATEEKITGLAEVITASNLAALPPLGLAIPVPTGTIVLCTRLSNRGTAMSDGSSVPSAPLYVFYWQPPANVLVRVDSNAYGGGCYHGTIFSGLMSADGTANFSLPQGLTAGQTCLIENLDEQGQGTHWLIADGSRYAEGVWCGQNAGMSGSVPVPIIRVQRGVYRIDSPQVFGAATARTTPASDTWDRTQTTAGADYGDTPITLWVGTGVYYDPTADEPQIVQHMRQLTIAADGRIASLSAETDYVVDTPVECS